MADATPGDDRFTQGEPDARREALQALAASDVDALVAGAHALFERDLEDAFRVLESTGFRTEIGDPAWIGRGHRGEWHVDLAFSSENGVATVDELWFEHARPARVMGVDALLVPPEELIWSKAFILERERFDGHDVSHLLRSMGEELDWDRLLHRFDRYWEVLLSHLALFRFAYPGERSKVPDRIVLELARRLGNEIGTDHPRPLCRGNLISRVEYEHDLQALGYEDGRRWDERARREGAGGGLGDGGGDRNVPAGGG